LTINILVIGLGSMGKRRIRCLRALGVERIVGYDRRADRRAEVESLWPDISCSETVEAAMDNGPYAGWVISVPPAAHVSYMNLALEHRTGFFVEASVVDTGLDAVIRAVAAAGIVAAPSRTLCYHPAIKEIKRIVASGELGKISNVLLHSGQYLPDWHVYEDVSQYYVSEPETGGCREIVPFELTWFTDIFGFPRRVGGNCRRTIRIEGAERIDDTYNCLLDYGEHLAVMVVDVVSRYATRRLMINGADKQLLWSWDIPEVKVYDPGSNTWDSRAYSAGPAASGYNPNISEGMYLAETEAFLRAIRGLEEYPGTLAGDHATLKLLYSIETSDAQSRIVPI
jgi:predicted dehydrogenase